MKNSFKPDSIQIRPPKKYKKEHINKHFLKCKDIVLTSFGLDATGFSSHVTNIAEGLDADQRLGRQVQLHSLTLRAFTEVALLGTLTQNICRVVLVYDTQSNGVTPTWASVFKQTLPSSLLNIDRGNRYRILWDWYFGLGAVSTDTDTPDFKVIKHYIPLNLTTTYKGTGGAASNLSTGGLFIMGLGSLTTFIGHNLLLTWRLRYSDS